MPNENGLTTLAEFAQQVFLIGRPPVMAFTQDGQRVDRELLAVVVQMRQAQATEALAQAMSSQAGPHGRLDLRQLLKQYQLQLEADVTVLRHQHDTLPLPHPPADQSPSFFMGALLADQLTELRSQQELVAGWLQQLAERPLPEFDNLRTMARAWASEKQYSATKQEGAQGDV